MRQTPQTVNLLYSRGRSPSAENSSFVFSAWSPSNGKFCSEAQNRKREVSRTDFPNSPKANHCTLMDENCHDKVLTPFLKGGNMSICQLCAENSLLPEERNNLAASFLNEEKSRVALTVKGYPRCSHQNQTATKNNQVPHFDADTSLCAGSIQALSLKGED